MQQIDLIKRIYDNKERLAENFINFPEAEQATENLETYLKDNFLSSNKDDAQKQWIALESYISLIALEYEKQGFVYGFQYAAALLAGGKTL